MRNEKIISINKIVAFVFFTSAAIITSLFIFHAKHQAPPNVLSPDIGMLFSEARDIQPFNLLTHEQKPFQTKDLLKHWSLVFFGFTHCEKICPTTLDLFNHVYPTLHAEFPNLQIIFVSLDPNRDTPLSLNRYIQSYNPAFIAVTGKIQELRKLQSQLGIYSRKIGTSATDYQLQHTSSILLINPQGKWAGLFKYGLTPNQFEQGMKDSIKRLS